MPTFAPAGTARTGPNAYDDLHPHLCRLAVLDADDPERGPLREHVIREFLPLVHNLSHRFATQQHSFEDIEQVGVLGLIKAIDRYDPEAATGGPLGYLVPSVRGEMKRHLRDHGWMLRVPRDLKDLGTAITQVTGDLTARLGRPPRPSELAAELDVSTPEVVDALGALDSRQVTPLDPAGPNGEPALAERIGHDDPDLDAAAVRHELRASIDELPERERRILLLRFFGNRTQSEIAAEVGISQMHVSRLLTRTVAALRDRLDAG